MSDLDYLAAATGALEGFSSVYVPFKKLQFEDALTRRRDAEKLNQELSLYQAKLPIERAQNRAKKSDELALEYPYKMAQYENQNALQEKRFSQQNDILDKRLSAQNDALDKRLASGKKEAGLEALIRETADNLPKQETEARSARTGIESINSALALVEKGGVTGKGGEFKAWLAPYAEAAGVETKSLSDAQKYQLLTRVVAGPLRSQLIGPGPVSEYEQKLIQQISGGGGASKGAAKELLTYYKRLAKDKVTAYNTSREGALTLTPRFGDIHKAIDLPAELPAETGPEKSTGTTVMQGKTPGGRGFRVIR